MKKIIFLSAILLLLIQACQKKDEGIVPDTSLQDIDNFLYQVNDLSRVIFLKSKSLNYNHLHHIKILLENGSIGKDEAYSQLSDHFGIDKTQFLDIESSLDKIRQIKSFESLIENRYLELAELGIIDTKYFPDGGKGARAPCWWIAARAVLKSVGMLAAGCILDGPAAIVTCGAAVGLTAIEIADATIELCEQCGCE